MLKFASYFTSEELQKNAGLLSFLRPTTVFKFVKFLARNIKKMMTWALTTYGISNLGDLYEKVKEDPTAVFDPEARKTTLNPFRKNEGPFENLFRIATYAFPAFSGLFGGTMMLIVDKVLSKEYELGFEDLGKKLDQTLGLQAGNEVNVDEPQIESALNSIFKIGYEEKPKYENNLKELKTLLGE